VPEGLDVSIQLPYAVLRANGCDPIIRNGGLHFLIKESSEGNLGMWAAIHDPAGTLRLERQPI
jgi:hypothetical protein